jgi:hypothetical protein
MTVTEEPDLTAYRFRTLIDQNLGWVAEREWVGVDEVIDLLLDMRNQTKEELDGTEVPDQQQP